MNGGSAATSLSGSSATSPLGKRREAHGDDTSAKRRSVGPALDPMIPAFISKLYTYVPR